LTYFFNAYKIQDLN